MTASPVLKAFRKWGQRHCRSNRQVRALIYPEGTIGLKAMPGQQKILMKTLDRACRAAKVHGFTC
jgi:hypothetical protein